MSSLRTRMVALVLACLCGGGQGTARAQFQGFGTAVTTPDRDFTPSGGSASVQDIQGGDLDGDGIHDIVFLLGHGYLGYIPGQSDGLLSGLRQVTAADGSGLAFELLDYDGDGDLDVVRAAQLDGGEFRAFRNDGAGGFTLDFAITNLGTLVARKGLVMADYDNDGDKDCFVLANTGVRIITKIPGGFSMSPVVVNYPNFTGVAIDAADLDGDGRTDAVVVSSALNQLIVLRSNGTTLVDVARIAFDAQAQDVKLVDMDGDGDKDLLASANSTDRVRVFTNTGGAFAFAYSVAASDPREIEVDDIDADGDMDLIVLSRGGLGYESGDRALVFTNDSMGFFTANSPPYTMFFDDFDTLAIIDVVPSTGLDLIAGFHDFSGRIVMRPNQTPFEGPGSFGLIAPANNAAGLALPASVVAWGGQSRARLEWEEATGIDVRYTVRISLSPSLAGPVFERSGLSARFIDLPALTLGGGTRYYWGVTAANSAGTSQAGPFSFTTVSGEPPCRADFNRSGGAPTVQDVFDFLTAYFAGC